MGEVEIRIVLDRVEPPTGCLGVLGCPDPAERRDEWEQTRFTGWLGLLRALYEVTESARR